MSVKNIEVHTLDEELEDHTDYERVDNLTDEEIEQAVAEDPDQELLDAEWFENAELVVPGEKEQVTLDINRDVLEYFKDQGDYKARMNAVLLRYVRRRERRAAQEKNL